MFSKLLFVHCVLVFVNSTPTAKVDLFLVWGKSLQPLLASFIIVNKCIIHVGNLSLSSFFVGFPIFSSSP